MGEKDTKYGTKNLRVESALYRAAVGYKVKLKKPVKVKEEYNRPGEGKQVVERMVTVEEEKYVEPKITAQMFWLKNRCPDRWREKPPEAVPAPENNLLEILRQTLEDPCDTES